MKKSFILGSLASLGLLSSAPAAALFGVTTDNQLVSFDTSSPSTFLSSFSITGLFDGDGVTPNPNGSILNLTARPGVNPGEYSLYGIDNNANFYQISLNGVATLVSSGFTPAGFSAGFAYDPFNDNFVFGDDTGGNYSITTAGAVTTNANFTYAGGGTPSIFGMGIDPSFGTVFVIDAETDTLSTTFDPLFPSSGELTQVGSLGIDVTSFGGLVVDWDGNIFASLSVDGLTSSLYSIDPLTGAASPLGGFGGNGLVTVAVPEPSAALLGCLGALALLRRRRA
ncbi:MAG: DUF4394 domain-containing protein [Verrucomicrobiaceae bacterium]|nr:MAG: DUF4394 domain-containing protein [Verrucomicrobiaceae bacterium]